MKIIESASSRWSPSRRFEHLGLHHHVERGRGLVGDEDARVAGKRERNEHPLALTSRELMRVVGRAPRRHADGVEELRDPCRHVGRGPVQLDRLPDLISDSLHGVERVQRTLEDDGHLCPTHGAQAAWLHLQDVLAVEEHLARDARSARKHPQERSGYGRLPAPRLARETERLAGSEVERDATNGWYSPGVGPVGDVEIANGQKRRSAHRAWRRARRGSRISSTAPPDRE